MNDDKSEDQVQDDEYWMPQPGISDSYEAGAITWRLKQDQQERFHANYDDPPPPPDNWWRRIKRFFNPAGEEAKDWVDLKPDR